MPRRQFNARWRTKNGAPQPLRSLDSFPGNLLSCPAVGYARRDAPLQTAPCLALCGRALAKDRPEVAGVRRGAAYAAFRLASRTGVPRSDATHTDPGVNFVFVALHEIGQVVAAALGDARQRELYPAGAAMSMDDAVAYALANVDRRVLA
jgi:hypothetical protein